MIRSNLKSGLGTISTALSTAISVGATGASITDVPDNLLSASICLGTGNIKYNVVYFGGI